MLVNIIYAIKIPNNDIFEGKYIILDLIDL